MSNLYISNVSVPYRHDLRESLCRKLSFRTLHYSDDEGFSMRMGHTMLANVTRLLDTERPQIVITLEFSPVTIQLARYKKKYDYRLIALSDDSLDMIEGNDYTMFHRIARRIVPRLVDNVILSTPVVTDWYQAHFGKGLFMPIIADERRIRPELERVLPLSERLRPGEKPIVAFVGRFVGLKNIPTLIRAFEPWKERAQLVLIGDGPLRAELEEQAPYALFTGMLTGDELLAWYNLIDVLVLPSTQEAYGAVTGEALMAGAKVIVSRKAGSSDLVREGENGFVVDPVDVPALTDRIGRLLEAVPSGRSLVLRENLLPYRFSACMDRLLKEINSL